MADIRAAVQRLTCISTFHTPLGSRSMCIATIQDELEAAEYARKYFAIGRESYKKIWYKLHMCPDSISGQTYFSFASLCLVCL